MQAWLYQSVALLLTAPWWLPLAKQLVAGILEQSSPTAPARGTRRSVAQVLDRERRPFGRTRSATDGRRSPPVDAGREPRRLHNPAWGTGRRPMVRARPRELSADRPPAQVELGARRRPGFATPRRRAAG